MTYQQQSALREPIRPQNLHRHFADAPTQIPALRSAVPDPRLLNIRSDRLTQLVDRRKPLFRALPGK